MPLLRSLSLFDPSIIYDPVPLAFGIDLDTILVEGPSVDSGIVPVNRTKPQGGHAGADAEAQESASENSDEIAAAAIDVVSASNRWGASRLVMPLYSRLMIATPTTAKALATQPMQAP